MGVSRYAPTRLFQDVGAYGHSPFLDYPIKSGNDIGKRGVLPRKDHGFGGVPQFPKSPNVWGTNRGFGDCFPLSKGDFRELTYLLGEPFNELIDRGEVALPANDIVVVVHGPLYGAELFGLMGCFEKSITRLKRYDIIFVAVQHQ